MAQIEHIPRQVLREEQPAQVAPLSLQEQLPLQIPPVEQVEYPPKPEIEVHGIDSDLDEESGPATCPVNIFSSMTSFVLDI